MANKRPPIEMGELTENLKQSSGKGMSAFFPASSSPTSQDEIIPETPAPPSQPAENEVPSVVDFKKNKQQSLIVEVKKS